MVGILKNTEVAGIDGVSAQVFRISPPKIFSTLTEFINLPLSRAAF